MPMLCITIQSKPIFNGTNQKKVTGKCEADIFTIIDKALIIGFLWG